MSLEPRLAAEIATRMLRPRVLDEGLRSGLFLIRQLNPGRWYTFASALAAELRCLGAEVIYLDAAEHGAEEIGTIQENLRTKMLAVRRQLTPIEPLQQSAPCDETLSELTKSIVSLSRKDLVLIFDHVSRLRDQPGVHLLKALKAARDVVNVPAGAEGRFLLIAVDRDPTAVTALTSDSNQAFFGAAVLDLNFA